MTVSGVFGGLLAAIFGFIDWLALLRTSRAKRIGAWHGLGNFFIVLLNAVSAWLRGRRRYFVPDQSAKLLSITGSGLALMTAWLGGELVYRLGVGVDPGAHVNAPSSLTLPTSSRSER